MSKLAKKITSAPAPEGTTAKRGPNNQCFPLYGAGDQEDFDAVEALREGRSWRDVQAHIDKLAGVEKPLSIDKFRYHWRRRCYCWPDGLRL